MERMCLVCSGAEAEAICGVIHTPWAADLHGAGAGAMSWGTCCVFSLWRDVTERQHSRM